MEYLLPLFSQAVPFFCLECTRLGPHWAVKWTISWCNVQDTVSKYLPGYGGVTMQHVLNTTWNWSAFCSLGTKTDGGKPKSCSFILPQTAHMRMNFPEQVWCDRVKIVLAPHHVGQRLHNPLTATWNLLRLSYLPCHGDSWFPSQRLKGLVPIEMEIILRYVCFSKVTTFLYRHESSKLAD